MNRLKEEFRAILATGKNQLEVIGQIDMKELITVKDKLQ